jgi:hypothetical protein
MTQQLLAAGAQAQNRRKSNRLVKYVGATHTHLLVLGVQVFLDLPPLVVVRPLAVESPR